VLSVAVAGLLIVIVVGVLGLGSAATVLPAGMPGPLTYMPTARFATLLSVTAVEPSVSDELVRGMSMTSKLAAVVFELMVNVVGLVIAVIAAPIGIPGPVTGWPTLRPDVLVTVMTFERPSVCGEIQAARSIRAGAGGDVSTFDVDSLPGID
jgi:hypothetical protein